MAPVAQQAEKKLAPDVVRPKWTERTSMNSLADIHK
jgi:hypothetical protein